MKKHGVSSLAAPTKVDLARLRAMSKDERASLIRTEIDEGREDIKAGRFIELATDADIHEFFEASRGRYEVTTI